jgi:hypothetical protein
MVDSDGLLGSYSVEMLFVHFVCLANFGHPSELGVQMSFPMQRFVIAQNGRLGWSFGFVYIVEMLFAHFVFRAHIGVVKNVEMRFAHFVFCAHFGHPSESGAQMSFPMHDLSMRKIVD